MPFFEIKIKKNPNSFHTSRDLGLMINSDDKSPSWQRCRSSRDWTPLSKYMNFCDNFGLGSITNFTISIGLILYVVFLLYTFLAE